MGNVEEFLIQGLPINTNIYATVKSFDFAPSPNVSAPSGEVARLLTLTEVTDLVAVPDQFIPSGGVLNLFWQYPVDPNVSGVNIYRTTVGPTVLGSLVGTVTVPFNRFIDTDLVNATPYFYTLKTLDFSSPVVESTGSKTSATPVILFGVSPPSVPKNLALRDNVTSIDLKWDANIETNVDHYEVHHATTLADLTASPTIVVIGAGLIEAIISGLGPEDDFYAHVIAVDTGALESDPSNVVSRLIRDSRVDRTFVQQRAEAKQSSLIFNTVHDVVRYEVDVDVVPTFDSVNQVLTRLPQIEDYTLIDTALQFPLERKARQTWYWRVRPVYIGDIAGLFSTQFVLEVPLKGTVPVPLRAGATIIPSSVVVQSVDLVTTYVLDTDYSFDSGIVTRIPAGAITDAQVVRITAEVEQKVFVRSNHKITSQEVMNATLDELYYVRHSRTTNIFKWFEVLGAGMFNTYRVENLVNQQGLKISKCLAEELFSRYGKEVGLSADFFGFPSLIEALLSLNQSLPEGGTKQSFKRVCEGITARDCEIVRKPGLADSGWILFSDAGPPPGFPDYVLSPSGTLPPGFEEIVLSALDLFFSQDFIIHNAARGAVRDIVRSRETLADSLGQDDIVASTVTLLDASSTIISPTRFNVDLEAGLVQWNVGQAPPDDSIYTAIYGFFLRTEITEILNLVLPVHLDPNYDFRTELLQDTLP